MIKYIYDISRKKIMLITLMIIRIMTKRPMINVLMFNIINTLMIHIIKMLMIDINFRCLAGPVQGSTLRGGMLLQLPPIINTAIIVASYN